MLLSEPARTQTISLVSSDSLRLVRVPAPHMHVRLALRIPFRSSPDCNTNVRSYALSLSQHRQGLSPIASDDRTLPIRCCSSPGLPPPDETPLLLERAWAAHQDFIPDRDARF